MRYTSSIRALVGVAALVVAADAQALELSASPLVRGSAARFTVTDATPGSTVVVVGGASTRGAAEDERVAPGVQLGVAEADPDGIAVVTLTLSDGAPVGWFVFQALERGAGVASPVLHTPIAAAPVVPDRVTLAAGPSL